MSETTGHADFQVGDESFQTWYKVVGDLKAGVRPLVVLHGGPGFSHVYMLAHSEIYTTHNIPVIFYDQIGIGKSTHPQNKPKEFWSLDLFKDELDNLLKHLGVHDDFDLLGHSWGGMLAGDYAATRHPEGLRRLIIANSPASMELWATGMNKLLDALPKEIVEDIRKHEREGTTGHAEYQRGMGVFYQKHICQLNPWPQQLQQGLGAMVEDPTVYSTMIGISEFTITGTLKTWSIIDHLPTISYPTLIINGEEDEAQDVCVLPFFQKIPKVKWVKFAKSSHLPFMEEKERYFEVVGDFLTV